MVEYGIKHYFVVRMASATLLLMGGLMMAAFGYRYKDCEFWIEGFLAGLVVWSVLFSVMIAYFGVCRGQYIDTCEPKIMLILIVTLSSGCACVTVKLQAAQEFLAGFDLGAMVGAFVFLAFYHEEVFHTFISVEDSKAIETQMLACSCLTGLAIGFLTTKFTKLVLVIGTSIIGSFGIVIAGATFFSHYLDTPDLVAWVILAVVFSFVQYFGTAHRDSRYDRIEQRMKDEELEDEDSYRS